MAEGQNTATIVLAVIFGALCGMVLLVLLAWHAGFLNWDKDGNAHNQTHSATPAMDRLNAYQCRKGETKHIVMGGVEDNFATGNIETVADSKAQKLFAQRIGNEQNVSRTYDERGVDNIFHDEFKLPARTVHGIMAIKVKELSTLKNDGLSIGYSLNDFDNYYSQAVHLLAVSSPWTTQHGFSYAALSDLVFTQRQSAKGKLVPLDHTSVLDVIQADQDVTVRVSDDTMVDYIGFALCTAPLENNGTSFLVNQIEVPSGLISLTCKDAKGHTHCDLYKGDTVCETALPVACFNDTQAAVPDSILGTPIQYLWSGGDMKFSPPRRGDSFGTQDDVHAYCRAEFGQSWRAASGHDGSQASSLIAHGTPPPAQQVWMDTKAQPYANCWALRPDYDAMEKTASQTELSNTREPRKGGVHD